jgi:2'-5' RNA ligase
LEGQTVRLFVALELDDQARRLLADCQRQLADLDPSVRWVRPEQIHLTLKFLGEVPDPQVPSICQSLDGLTSHGPVDFEMTGAGWFGSSRSPRVIWVGLAWPNAALEALQKDCESRMAAEGFPPEARAYRPHLTLGRVRDGRGNAEITRAIEAMRDRGVGPLAQTATEVVLFESRLHPSGAEYVPAHQIPLTGRG